MIFTPEELFHISLAYHFVRRTYLKGTNPWDLILSKPNKFVNPMNGLNTSATAIVEKHKSLSQKASKEEPKASKASKEGTTGTTAVTAGQVGQSQTQIDEIMQEFIGRWGMLAHYNRIVMLSKYPNNSLFLQLRDETIGWLVNTVKSATEAARAEGTVQTAGAEQTEQNYENHDDVALRQKLLALAHEVLAPTMQNKILAATEAIWDNPNNFLSALAAPDFLELIKALKSTKGKPPMDRITVAFPAKMLKNKEKLKLLPLPVKIEKHLEITGTNEDLLVFDWFPNESGTPKEAEEIVGVAYEFVEELIKALDKMP